MVISNVATVKKACRSRLADPRSWRGVTAASTTTRSSAMARSARVSIGSALPGPSRPCGWSLRPIGPPRSGAVRSATAVRVSLTSSCAASTTSRCGIWAWLVESDPERVEPESLWSMLEVQAEA